MENILHHVAHLSQAQSCMSGTTLHIICDNVVAMSTIETLIKNTKLLMRIHEMDEKALSKKSGVSLRMVYYVLSGERKPTIDIADKLASALGVTGWQLILPSLTETLAKNSRLNKLIDDYSKCSKESQDYIFHVAEREAKYK